MDEPLSATPEGRLFGATGRSTLREALSWIADDYPLSGDSTASARAANPVSTG